MTRIDAAHMNANFAHHGRFQHLMVQASPALM
jgi:hypothetical protein